MSKEMREQINKVKNWKQFLNENKETIPTENNPWQDYEEAKRVLNESIDSGSFILYHRTRNNPLDFNKGFKVSKYGGKYGSGLYAFYNLSNATDDYRALDYGDYIIEINVQNNGKFLFLDPKLLKKVYGRNISLIEQLKKVFGGKFTHFYKENKQIIDNLNELNLEEGENSSNILGALVFRCKGFFQGCDGAAVVDDRLDEMFILYETDLMNPLRYSKDEGKTWISIKNKESFGIGKDDRNKEDKLYNQKYSGFDDKGFQYID